MTCIVGLVEDGVTWIGADSLGSNNYSKTVRKDKKVFKLKDTNEAILGYTSSFRMGQLLMYAKDLIDTKFNSDGSKPVIDHEYMVTKFIPSVIDVLERGGYSRNNSGEKSGGTFLLGYKDKLWKIYDDFQVAESIDRYDSCGSGEYFALGSLKTTEEMDLTPTERIHMALQAASKFSTGCQAPYYIFNTKDDKVIEFKE